MKKNKKGFMLIETLIVSSSGILIYLYMQFSNVNDSYNKSFKYNSVENLYKSADVKENILYNGLDKIYTDVDANVFVDLSTCPTIYYSNTNYCKKLYELLDVKTVIVTKNELKDINSLMKSSTNVNKYSETIREFMEKIADTDSGYQLIVEYNDSTASAVSIKR